LKTLSKMQEQLKEKKHQYPEERMPAEKATSGWKRWLNYQAVVKQVPFFLFLALLAVIYIYNGHYADKTIRSINHRSKEVKELQYEYIDIKSKVMGQSKPSELVKAVEPLGLKELIGTPVVLKDTMQ
jgi:hypothetical protein